MLTFFTTSQREMIFRQLYWLHQRQALIEECQAAFYRETYRCMGWFQDHLGDDLGDFQALCLRILDCETPLVWNVY